MGFRQLAGQRGNKLYWTSDGYPGLSGQVILEAVLLEMVGFEATPSFPYLGNPYLHFVTIWNSSVRPPDKPLFLCIFSTHLADWGLE